MVECENVYVRVPLHIKQVLLKFMAEPYQLTGRGYGIKDKLIMPIEQPEIDPNNKYHYIIVLAQGRQDEKSLAHLTDVLASQANMLMIAWVISRIQAGQSGMEAVASFLQYCEVAEETYSQESCYRQWVRIKAKLMS